MARRLPVIQSPPSEDAAALERSGGQWLLIGAAFTVVTFLPLSIPALWAGSRLSRAFATTETAAIVLAAVPVLLGYSAAAWGAGAIIGRFGLRAHRTVPAASGALAGTFFVLFSLWKGAGPWQLTLGAACIFMGGGALAASLGGRFGRKRRPGISS